VINDVQERRKHTDIWVYSIRILTLLSWLLFIIALITSYFAAPEKDYGYLRFQNIAVREFWLVPLTGYLSILLWLSALMSYISLLINKYRSRRKTDNKRFNLLLLFVISVAWITYILLHIVERAN